jgi:hypothetical protein
MLVVPCCIRNRISVQVQGYVLSEEDGRFRTGYIFCKNISCTNLIITPRLADRYFPYVRRPVDPLFILCLDWA